jgi:hypothetical protein
MTKRMIPIVHRMAILAINPTISRMMPRVIIRSPDGHLWRAEEALRRRGLTLPPLGG